MSSIFLQYLKVSSILLQYESWAELACRGTLSDFLTSIFVKSRKLKGDPLGKKLGKNAHNAKKILKREPLGFCNIYSVAKHQKIEGASLGEKKFEKKSHSAEKIGDKEKNSYKEKEEKPFWFNSLSQMIHFGTIKFLRTFKNYFRQFVWIEKRVTIIVTFSLYEAPTTDIAG